MEQESSVSTSSLDPLQSELAQDRQEFPASAKNKREHIFITHIRATDIMSGLQHIPTGFCIAVQYNGKTITTSNKPVLPGQGGEVEWDDEILLPSERSSSISFSVYASFEPGPILGNEKLLRQFSITVDELLDHARNSQPIAFPDILLLSCASLRVITEHRICDVSRPNTIAPESGVADHRDDLSDCPHCDFLCYHESENEANIQQYVEQDGGLRETIQQAHSKLLQLPAGDSDRPVILAELGGLLFHQYKHSGVLADIHEAISVLESGLELILDGDPLKVDMLALLGTSLSMRFQQLGDMVDINRSISTLEQVVILTPNDHPDKPSWLNNLGIAFTRRFWQLGDIADYNMSVSVLEEAVDITPDGHPDKPTRLSNLGVSFRSRFQQLGDMADLDKSISMLEQALNLTPADHPDKPNQLNGLGISLQIRFKQLGNMADMNKSISLLEEASYLLPIGHPNKPDLLSNLGTALKIRFEQLGDLTDMSKSISILEEAMSLFPKDHPGQSRLLNNLGTALKNRFERLHDKADISKSVSMLGHAVSLTPDDHPEKPVILTSLANSLLSCSEQSRDIADINRAVSMLEKALSLTSQDHPQKPARLNNLGISLRSRFHQLGDIADINKSISVMEESLGLISNNHPNWPVWLGDLGISLKNRFQQLGNMVDLGRSISMLEEAINLAPSGHPEKPSWLNNLGKSLQDRFYHLGQKVDIDKSILLSEEAVNITPDGYPEKACWMNTLGGSLLCRFQQFGDIKDIDRSVTLLEEGVSLTPFDHSHKLSHLSDLATSFWYRFERTGDMTDMNNSLSLLENIVSLAPDGHPSKPGWLDNFGKLTLQKYHQRPGNIADIKKSVSMLEDAVSLTPAGHPERPTRLSNLGISLRYYFQQFGHMKDVNKSVLVLEEAISLTPNGDPHKASMINSLGISYLNRFEKFGDLADMKKSVLTFEKALNLTSNDHPYKPNWLNNVGISLQKQYEISGDMADIEKSISTLKEAVRLTPDDNPDKPMLLVNLGDTLHLACKNTQDPTQLSESIKYYSAASKSSVGSISVQFGAAQKWIHSASLLEDQQTLLDACTTSIHLLPQLAWLALPLPVKERHQILLNAVQFDIAQDTAAAAVQAGYPNMAVEWLEQGRSIVWGQMLELRAPVGELSSKHPDLAKQFLEICHQLEHASWSGHLTSDGPMNNLNPFNTNNESVQERAVQRYHDLAIRRKNLIRKIQSLEGFDHFLLPNTIKQLSAFAYSGPVIYLNASKHRCDALIVTAESNDVIHVPLSSTSFGYLKHLLHLLLMHDHPVVSRDHLSTIITPEKDNKHALQQFLDIFLGESDNSREGGTFIEDYDPETCLQMILASLWKDIVRPILEALSFSIPPSSASKLPRIFWCPTGPFTFLPIHAAGIYDKIDGPKLSDFAISSYVPTLSSLMPLSKSVPRDSYDPPSAVHLVTVAQPQNDGQQKLPCVKIEMDHIKSESKKSASVVRLEESDGTVEDVMEKMTHANWVHFACHGIQDRHRPLESGLCLANKQLLKLSDIIRLSRPQGGLAFLSACQTATGDKKLSEESVHLAAGMLLAGYGSVIATMWSIKDKDAPNVTKKVYEYLLRDGNTRVPDSTESAEALHYAVQDLRKSDVLFSSWVPFIHYGR